MCPITERRLHCEKCGEPISEENIWAIGEEALTLFEELQSKSKPEPAENKRELLIQRLREKREVFQRLAEQGLLTEENIEILRKKGLLNTED
jgi:hypothetical protein